MADAVYVITHFDFAPPNADAGKDVLQRHAVAAAREDGVLRWELLQQLYKKNHFEAHCVFRSLEDYEAHLARPATVAYREELHPLLGSPIDDRVHSLAWPSDQ